MQLTSWRTKVQSVEGEISNHARTNHSAEAVLCQQKKAGVSAAVLMMVQGRATHTLTVGGAVYRPLTVSSWNHARHVGARACHHVYTRTLAGRGLAKAHAIRACREHL